MSDYSLSELAVETGVEARTIRSWVQQGLVPGPDALGRNARYPAASLARIRAISAMRALYGMSLPAIRQELLVADAATIERYAAAQAGSAAPPDAANEAAHPPPGSSAAEYLQMLRTAGAFEAGAPAPPAPAPSTPVPVLPAPAAPAFSAGDNARRSPLKALVARLESELGGRPLRRKARGDVRMVIPVTPELELSLRGNLAPEEVAYFERLADAIREWLNGGNRT